MKFQVRALLCILRISCDTVCCFVMCDAGLALIKSSILETSFEWPMQLTIKAMTDIRKRGIPFSLPFPPLVSLGQAPDAVMFSPGFFAAEIFSMTSCTSFLSLLDDLTLETFWQKLSNNVFPHAEFKIVVAHN